MALGQFKPIVSSNLQSAAYDPAARVAHVRFKNGTEYKYEKFPNVLWKSFEMTFDGKTVDQPANSLR
jgi:hypothetical protein